MAFELIAVGASWGGLRALRLVLPALPAGFPAAVAVVQHRRPDSPGRAMAAFLGSASALPVREVEDKDPIEPGRVYLAPADYHLIVEPGHFSLSTEDSVDFSRPSVDVLFETAADSYGEGVIAVVLTGLKDDGARGVRAVKREGGIVVVQHPDSAEKADMPAAAISTGFADHVVALGDLGRLLVELVSSTARAGHR